MWPLHILKATLVIISVVPGPAQLSCYHPMAALDECVPVMVPFNFLQEKENLSKGTWNRIPWAHVWWGKKKASEGDGKWIILFLGSKRNPILLPSSREPPLSASVCGDILAAGSQGNPAMEWPRPQLQALCFWVGFSLYQHLFIPYLLTKQFPGASLKHF